MSNQYSRAYDSNDRRASSQEQGRAYVPQRGSSSGGYPPAHSAGYPNDRTSSHGGYDRQSSSPHYGQRSTSSYRPSNNDADYGSQPSHQQYPPRSTYSNPGASSGSGSKWTEAAASIQENYDAPPLRTWETVDDEPENYDDSGWLERKTKKSQMDSLTTSQRALEKVNHAQLVAQNNLEKLALQSEQLTRIDKRLEDTDQHVKISDAKTDRLKALNRFFMIPAIGSKKAKKREEKLTKEFDEKKNRHMQEGLREQERLERARMMNQSAHGSHSTPQLNSRGSSIHGSQSHLYSTPAGLERDEVEVNIDSNLNQISAGLSRLKMMGQSMNEELGTQHQQMRRIQDRTDSSRDGITRVNRKMDHIAGNKR